jgi:hypothetical protein
MANEKPEALTGQTIDGLASLQKHAMGISNCRAYARKKRS